MILLINMSKHESKRLFSSHILSNAKNNILSTHFAILSAQKCNFSSAKTTATMAKV
eukprot:m.55958 g.55958  ORF g.55958 m.55958 type:complete len:56 (+) comp11012_c0_seq2:133-300(+)